MTKPNILFIVADDLNAWIGPLGRHPDVRTPCIDALDASPAADDTMIVLWGDNGSP